MDAHGSETTEFFNDCGTTARFAMIMKLYRRLQVRQTTVSDFIQSFLNSSEIFWPKNEKT